ncbi:MAG: prepilin peptidase [Eubacteriales bacterium]|nr:prepilin peptidase [Eubacteriales bacterium]
MAGFVTEHYYISLILALLFSLALIISIIDLSIHIIPNELVLAMIALGVLFQLLYFDWKSMMIAMACLLVLMGIFAGLAAILGFSKVGAGDVKLAGAMGLVLGYPYILTAVFVMSAVMLLYCVIGIFIGKLTLVSMFPYAPFLMIGMNLGLLSVFITI